uniref:Zn(2)-C6 fungal-type domain-containing protein n=2 Tax=Kalmanozyma brasiliensis (strain GHG001) TaxID=1365824 RepID=V5F3E1_KALBG
MASRKQNSACDACRSRKVRCNRDPGEARCNHCKAKNIDCTTLYVQWATSSAKRPTKRPRSSLHVPPEEKKAAPEPPEIVDAAVQAQDRLLNVLFQRDTEYAATDNQLYLYQSLPLNAPQSASGYTTRTIVPSSYLPGPKPAATTSAELHLLDRQRREDFVNDLVETFFSVVHARFPLLNPQLFRKRYYERSPEVGGAPPDVILALVIAWGAKFSENPLIAQDREESSSELKKAHSQAAMALNKGETEKANQITGVKGGIEQPILTVPQELRERGRNRIGEHLIWRAQDIMDRSRVSRVPSLENIQACFLMEALLLHPSIYYNGNVNLAGTPITAKHRSSLSYTTGHWFYIAIKHLLDLGLNCKEKVMAIKDAALRGEIMFVWWSACWADSVAALYFQRHHILSPEQYNNDPHAADAENKNAAPHPLNSLDSYHSFYGSVYDALIFQRTLAAMYFAPRSYVEGVRMDTVVQIVAQLRTWRDVHLDKVGVPLPHWPAHWDYIAAVSACVSDINYHANWIILWRLIDEMGIYGTDRSDATSPLHQERLKRRVVPDPSSVPEDERPDPEQVQTTLATIQEEALASALRIAGLTDILRTNQYLRLDPCNSLQSLELAAHMLIRFQRSEIDIIVAGFRQYALSYEDCFDKADLMEELAEAYMERARTDPGFVPGSALGLARERDVEGGVGEGIPELAIAAAALSNAAASANGVAVGEGEFGFEGHLAEAVGGEVRDEGAFEGMFEPAQDGLDQACGDVALEGHE